MRQSLSRHILFVFLLPAFFVLHGFTENFDLVPASKALLLTAWYFLAAAVLLGLNWLYFRDYRKAGLSTFFLLGYHFFFGVMQDGLHRIASNTFLTRYSFILTLSLVGFIFLFLLLKKSKGRFPALFFYLNLLLTILFLTDAGILALKIANKRKANTVPRENLVYCADCPNPDIYLVIADGYPGKDQLREILHFDNRLFEEELRARGFHITDSSLANYNYTFFSMGSILNLNYLANIKGSIQNKDNIPAGNKILKDNQVLKFLRQQGYEFYNYSLFDLKNSKAITKPTFWINDTRPITMQTFLSRLNRDLGFHLISTLNIRPADSYPPDQDLKNNELVFAETIKTSANRKQGPKFVYTHLVMPHHPYYFDSTGRKTPLENLTKLYAFDKAAAVSYLVYSNKKYLELIDSILVHSIKPPVIMLVSDHGFREITEVKDRHTSFLNLNAVLIPGNDYSGFYKGMSNVNLFRVILNSGFRQQLPILKDSTIFIED